MARLATVLLETLVERTEERIALAGTANLARGGLLDFQGIAAARSWRRSRRRSSCSSCSARSSRASPGSGSATRTRSKTCASTSVVSTGYGPGATVVGGMGVLGPTRMDYPGTIATVRAVARYVGDLLATELTACARQRA